MDDSDLLEEFFRILRDHDIEVNQDDVRSSFESPSSGSALRSWMNEYLGEETLLSKEELQLFTSLEGSRTLRTIVSKHDLSTVTPLTDDELRSAISDLENSTKSIESHNQKLQEQQRALSKLKEKAKKRSDVRDRARGQQLKKWQVEKEHVTLATEELGESLQSELSALAQRAQAGITSLNSTKSHILKNDDAVLARLQKLMDVLSPAVDEGAAFDPMRTRARLLCNKLISLKSEEVQSRLDRIFLESQVTSAAADGERGNKEHDDIQADIEMLKDELESLYSEITSVAQMSVERDYLQPLLRHIESHEVHTKHTSAAKLEYVLSMLEYLTNRLEIVANRSVGYDSHCKAVKEISAAFAVESHDPEAGRSASPSKPQSPVRTRSGKPLLGSPTKTNRSRRRSSINAPADESMPGQQLFATLGLSYLDLASSDDLDQALSETSREQRSRLNNQLTTLENSTNATLATYLDASKASLQILKDTLYVDSRSGRLVFIDENVTSELARLETHVGDIKNGISRLDLEPLRHPDKRQERFVERWSR
ncbi:MAG: hypothetical protein M4579_003907 [Chaenotheca gracillima]|nr:MAG: hypothetical protein M4579_003907 [Chaenotheca gracillima]